jgi:uncharacterized damage-inducible protein DinB
MRPTPGTSRTATGEFVDASRTLLAHDYLPKVIRCVEMLPEEDVWWRPNDASNSVGNMLLHLCGNLREWIVGGAGGRRFERDRPWEFAARGGKSKAKLLAELDQTVRDVESVLADLCEDSLMDRVTVQGFEVSRLHAVYHSVEHFSYHLGQIAYVVKLRCGQDLEIF